MKERLKKLRKSLGLTQQAFANRIGIKRNSFANYETGRNTPIDAIIVSICREFNVNEEWLRYGTGEMFNVPTDEVAAIVSEVLENPDTDFHQLILTIVRTYAELTPASKKVVDDYVRNVTLNLQRSIQ